MNDLTQNVMFNLCMQREHGWLWLLIAPQGEENTDLSDDGYNFFATDLPSRNIDSKKYIKFSKTTEKRISPEVRGLSPDHTKK